MNFAIDYSELMNYNEHAVNSSELLEGGSSVTSMRRVTVSLPEEMDKRILELKKEDRFVRCSYAEIVRQIVEQGLAAALADTEQEGG